MPRGDGTGPMGQGRRTGRGFGNCAGGVLPFVIGAVAGICLGFGRKNRFGQKNNAQGRGRGFGFGNRFRQGQEQ